MVLGGILNHGILFYIRSRVDRDTFFMLVDWQPKFDNDRQNLPTAGQLVPTGPLPWWIDGFD